MDEWKIRGNLRVSMLLSPRLVVFPPALMKFCLLCVSALLALLPCGRAEGDALVIDTMDAVTFKVPAEKAGVALVEGKSGGALRFSFPEAAKSAFATGRARGGLAWDEAAGFSFWVKGDSSAHLGALQLVWGEDYALRYDFAFPIDRTEWTKVVVPWRDLVPVLPAPGAKAIDAAAGNAPSKLGPFWFGKWWYWRDVAAHSYTIDDLRLERVIPLEARDFKPAGAPLARVLAKLKAGQPITIVTMGDSLTDLAHWANKPTNWPALLKAKLRERYKSEVTLVNPAIGGTQLRQNVVLIPHWTAQTPAPDLVTSCFGFNDWDAGMRGEMFFTAQCDAIDRIRRATQGNADVLLMTTAPALDRWTTMTELAAACRRAAGERNAGLADLEAAFHAVAEADRPSLYVNDKVHLAPPGHERVADAVLRAIENAGQ